MEILQASSSFTPDELNLLYRVFDECCQEAIVMRSTPLTARKGRALENAAGRGADPHLFKWRA
jgi:hypothetical protein